MCSVPKTRSTLPAHSGRPTPETARLGCASPSVIRSGRLGNRVKLPRVFSAGCFVVYRTEIRNSEYNIHLTCLLSRLGWSAWRIVDAD